MISSPRLRSGMKFDTLPVNISVSAAVEKGSVFL